jgi:predicted oxidoreductase
MELSPIVWGAWRLMQAQLTPQALNRWINECVAIGVTSFDHADIYGDYAAQAHFGQALALSPGLRSQVQLLSKCGVAKLSAARPALRVKTYQSSPDYIAQSIDDALLALGTDYLDLWMLHRPDYLMDACETAYALLSAQHSGKVQHVGVSNFSCAQVQLLGQQMAQPLAVHQVEFSLAARQALDNDTLVQCQQLGMTPMAWSPLAGGSLFNDSAIAQRLAPELARLAQQHGCDASAVALAWLMRCPSGVVPVIGTLSATHLQHAWQATQITLDHADWYSLLVAASGEKLL